MECNFLKYQSLQCKKRVWNYFQSQNSNDGYFDVVLKNTPLNSYFNSKIRKTIHSIFEVDETNIDIDYNLYTQNNNQTQFRYHNHIHTQASICGVFYTKIPKVGGEFQVIHSPFFPYERPLTFKPKINKIYFFPSWLYHSPSPQKDKETRICINITYTTHSRPIVKGDGVIW